MIEFTVTSCVFVFILQNRFFKIPCMVALITVLLHFVGRITLSACTFVGNNVSLSEPMT